MRDTATLTCGGAEPVADGAERLRAVFGQRDVVAAALLARGWAEYARICVLECGAFAEGMLLAGRDLSNITLVSPDPAHLAEQQHRHGAQIVLCHTGAARFLGRAHRDGSRFDLVYAMRSAEDLGDPALGRFLAAAGSILAPGGRLVIGAIAPDAELAAFARGGLGWRPRLRSAEALEAHARAALPGWTLQLCRHEGLIVLEAQAS